MTGGEGIGRELNTPCIIIDGPVMENNLARMAAAVAGTGCRWRPHIKTHKSVQLAKLQLAMGADGITVAKLGEAEVMAAGGIDNIFMAYPLVGRDKLLRAIALNNRLIRFIAAVDSLAGARMLSEAAALAGECMEVRCEIDTGMRRTGIPYDRAVAVIQEIAALPALRVTGIFTFRGAILDGRPTHDLAAAGAQEGRMMADLAAALREAGVDIAEVSVGSSPTALTAVVPGVSEVRPGTYIYNDAMQIKYGLCGEDDCAARIACRVISRPSPDLAVIDGGVKIFAADAPLHAPPYHFDRYGICPGRPGIILDRLSEEHGMIRLEAGEDPAIGEVLWFIPNHVCTCINLVDEVLLRDEAGWLAPMPVDARGRSR